MIVDRNYQTITYPIEELHKCSMPVVRVKHDFDIILSWGEIVETLNKSLITNELIMNLEREQYKLNHNNAVHYQAKRIQVKKIKPIENLLKEMFPEQYHETDIYGSYLNSMGGFKLHKDVEHSLLHLQQGEAIVNVVTPEFSYIFDMKPNDMVFIKRGVFHSVMGLTPRFLTSYGIFFDR